VARRREVELVVAGEAGVLVQQLLGEEADRKVAEFPTRELGGARVTGDRRGVREGVGQHMAAVVTDEDALLAGPRRERVRPVLQALVQRGERVRDAPPD